jgi:CTD small phosphatase-like protein 2
MLDPTDALIEHKIFRDKCIQKSNHYVKDLRILKNRDLKRVIIIDNSIVSFANQLDNGIHVPTFFGCRSDLVLLSILPLLKALAQVDNVQHELHHKIGLSTAYAAYLRAKC